MTLKLTQKQFIEKANIIHNNRYNYSKSIYLGYNQKLIIICSKHGEFTQAPSSHISGGAGCPTCGGTTALTTNEFIKKSNVIHINKYDYSKCVYQNNKTKIIIICKKHGEFTQMPKKHLIGQGCVKCAAEINGKKQLVNNDDIDLILINKNIKRIDDCIGSKRKIKFQCISCDYIWMSTPSHFMRKNSGCPKCVHRAPLDIVYVKQKLMDKNIILLSEYKNTITKTQVQCLQKNCKHIWSVRIAHILHSNSGCPVCSKAGLVNEKIVYTFLKNNNLFFYSEFHIKINNKRVLVDFYLSEFNLIIEYNGIQHYKPVCFGGISQQQAEVNFTKQQARDSLLRKYCAENKINLLEIDGQKYKNKNLIDYLKTLDFKNIKRAA